MLKVNKTAQKNLLLTAFAIIILACSSTNETMEKEIVGTYSGQVMTASFDQEIQSMAQSTKVTFVFNADKTAVYETSAMGNNRRAEGKFRIENDSLYIYDLGEVPDGNFKVTKLDNGQWQLSGIGNFLLTPIEE